MDKERHIPVVISEGELLVRGMHLGSSERPRVLHTVNAYMDMFKNISGLSRPHNF
jgi:hypothetical protein